MPALISVSKKTLTVIFLACQVWNLSPLIRKYSLFDGILYPEDLSGTGFPRAYHRDSLSSGVRFMNDGDSNMK